MRERDLKDEKLLSINLMKKKMLIFGVIWKWIYLLCKGILEKKSDSICVSFFYFLFWYIGFVSLDF